MSISANYVDEHTITLSGDYVHTIANGMSIRADCGVDGIRITKADKIEYKGGKTIIYTIPSESNDLTANLQTVDFSCIKPNSQKEIGNFGNTPSDWTWLFRGFRRGLYMDWVSWDEITLKPGMMHYYNYETERECIVTLESDVQWQGHNSAGYTAGYWYYIYLRPLDENTFIIPPETGSFYITSTAPSFDPVKFKWYHPTNYWNCIWFFCSNGTSGVHPFLWMPNVYFNSRGYAWERQEYRWTSSYVQTPSTDLPLTLPSGMRIMANFNFNHFWGYYIENYWYVKPTNVSPSPNAWIYRHTHTNGYGSNSADQTNIYLPIDSSKTLTLWTNADDNSTYYSYIKVGTRHFMLPIGFVET